MRSESVILHGTERLEGLIEIHEANAGMPDAALGKLALQYLASDRRRYRRAKQLQRRRPALRAIDGGKRD